MNVLTEHLEIQTDGNSEFIDITDQIIEIVRRSLLQEGTVSVFVSASTAGIATITAEEGAKDDVRNALESLVPQAGLYVHKRRSITDNAFAPVRATLVGASICVPFFRAKVLLGAYQSIVLIEFDTQPRTRNVVVQIIGQ